MEQEDRPDTATEAMDELAIDAIEESTASPRAEQWRQYLSLIRNTPQLTEDEENALGKLIQAGHRAVLQLNELGATQDANAICPDHQLQEQEAKDAIRAADKAKRKLVEHNLRLAAYLAMQFRGRKIAMMDLIQDANFALMKAAENWDYGTGKRFGFVAQLYVKHTLTESCYRSEFHVPKNALYAMKKIETVSKIIYRELGHVDDAAIARELNVPLLTVKQLRTAVHNTERVISLDAPMGGNDERTLADTISGSGDDNPELIICGTILHEKMAAVLASLEPIEEKVVRLRFGFEDGATHSHEEVGRMCGTSPQVIQLAEARALRKLRHPSRSGQLTGLL